MKKQNFLFSVLMALCAMTVTTVFTSCGGDDAPQQAPEGPTSATLYTYLLTNDETLGNFDFLVKYYDANGQVKEEKVVFDEIQDANGNKAYKWEKTVTANLPTTLGMFFEMKLKDGLDPQAQYTIALGKKCIPYTSKTFSEGFYSVSDYHVSRIRAGKLEEVLKNLDTINVIYHFDSKGDYTTSAWK